MPSREANPFNAAEMLGDRHILIIERSGKKKFRGTLIDLRRDREQSLGTYTSKAALRATANHWTVMGDI